MRKRPTLRRNYGSIVIRMRIDGEDRRIYRLGRWDDPVAVARTEAVAAEIWSDIQRKAITPITGKPMFRTSDEVLEEALEVFYQHLKSKKVV